MRREVRIAGFGGQGVVLAGYILGKALSIYAGLEAVMTQAHGPESRGGASSADLVLSENPIAYPFVQQPDYLVVLSQEAYTKFRPTARTAAEVFIDDDLVDPQDSDRVYSIPATRLAEDLGHRIVANVVMLGFFTATTGLIDIQSMHKALETSVKAKTLPMNLNAFNAGCEYPAVKR